MSLVDVAGLNVAFGRRARPVVRDVSFTIGEGECLALVGESGSGKSVTARSLLGLAGRNAVVSAERLYVAGADTTGFGPRDWQAVRGRVAGMVLQDAMGSLDPLRRISAEIAEPIGLHLDLDRRARADRVLELLREVGVPDPEARRSQYPHQLSGGLRQRALIASALAAEPPLLIADEPTTALDVLVQEQILRLLRRIKDEGRAILLVSHDLAVVSQLADRIAVVKDGTIVETGPARSVITAPRHAYTRSLIDAVPARATGSHLAATGEVILHAERISKTYGRSAKKAVDGVTLSLHAGETLGVVGESGSGKSTIARIAMGLLAPDEGEVVFDGQPWSGASERDRRSRRGLIQLIHQNPLAAFDPRFTVGRIVGEALPRLRRQARATRVAELLGQVGLDAELTRRRAHELSGGQRQRIAIARALAPRPRVLICDEPVSALDVPVQAQVLELLTLLQSDTGVALLFVTHDLSVVRNISDRLLIMKDGKAVEEGVTTEVFAQPAHPYTRALLAAVPGLLSV